jgi:hypothetical protein
VGQLGFAPITVEIRLLTLGRLSGTLSGVRNIHWSRTASLRDVAGLPDNSYQDVFAW